MNFWQKIRVELQEHPISFFGGAATLIFYFVVLINLLFTLPQLVFKAELQLPIPIGVDINLVLGVCIFFLLEGFLASVFGYFFVLTREGGRGIPLVFLNINGLISAWVSGFNCAWIFLPKAKTVAWAFIAFSSMFLVAYALAIYFVIYHFDKRYENREKKARGTGRKSKVKYADIKEIRQEKLLSLKIVIIFQTIYFIAIGIYFGMEIPSLYP